MGRIKKSVSDRRPIVAAIVDQSGWAHDFKTQQLAHWLGDGFQVRTVYQHEIANSDIANADLVLVYYWYQVLDIHNSGYSLEQYRNRLLLGVCSHCELDGIRRDQGLSILNRVASAVFVNNLMLYRELRPLVSPRLFYTPNGVDVDFFRPAETRLRSSDQVFRVGWAGSLTNHGREHRGLDAYIIPAVAGVEGAVLETAIREDRWRSRVEMRDFYRTLDVYVCASETEGTPNPCLEAAACGIPVISTAVGNMPEFIRDGENGFLVPRDVQALAARLRELKEEKSQRESMGHLARRSAEKWGWDKQADHFRRVFLTCLAAASNTSCDFRQDRSADFTRKVRRMQELHGLPWIWGAGAGGKRVASKLDADGIPWHGFIDSDLKKHGAVLAGRRVQSAEVLNRKEPATVIVASSSLVDICTRLVQFGRIEGEDFLVAPLDALGVRT
jgi:glycosyltransferase involved in cell wall biosynthesis